MSTGTKYTSKATLLTSILQKIFTNKSFKVTADKIQTAINDVIESLWNRRYDKVILTIEDDNVADYLSGTDLQNIPNDTDIISIEVTTAINVATISFVSTPSNGKEIRIVGNGKINLWQGDGTATPYQLSKYYYSFIDGHSGASQSIGIFQDFMLWNEVWYYDGY